MDKDTQKDKIQPIIPDKASKSSTLTVDTKIPEIKQDGIGDWNDCIEKEIKDIGESAKINKLMHIEVAGSTEIKYNRFMYSGIILGPLSGVITAINEIIPQSQEMAIVAILLGFISGIVIAILKFGKFDEVSSANKIAASRYTSLESNIRRQLSLYRKDRVSSKTYLEWVTKAYDELFLASPLIPQRIVSKYREIAQREGITVQDTQTIYINKEYEQQKIRELTDSTTISVNMSPESDRKSSTAVPLVDVKGNIGLKRSNNSFAHYSELGKFTDKQMEYEMKRFFNYEKPLPV